MLVRIADLTAGRNQFSFSAQGSELGLDGTEAGLAGPVTAEIVVEKMEASLVVAGTVVFAWNLPCSRCLEPVRDSFSVPFSMPGTVLDEGGQMPGDDEDMIVFDRQQTEFDLTDIVREQVLMALPEKPLCREDCRGLCPRCGADLNAGSCDCADEQIDARWQKLAELKKRKN